MRIFSLFLLLGTLIIQCLEAIPSWQLVLVILCLCIGIAFIFRNKSKLFDRVFIPVCAFLLGLGLASYQATLLVNSRITQSLEGKELSITGIVKGIPSIREKGVRFILNINEATLVGSPEQSIKLNGLVRLGWFQHTQDIQSGEMWHLKVKLKRPSGFMNSGGFDYEKWLFTQKIIATGYVRSAKLIDIKDNHKADQTISSNLLWSVDHWRQKIHTTIQQRVENKISSAVLSALLVAVRDKLSDQQWELLQATGTSHLIAISGLHIAVVAGFAFFPMMLLWRLFPRLNERIPLRVAGAIVGTLFALCYAMLAGLTLPTQRALLMVMIGLWGLVSRRNYDSSTIFSFALVLVLLWDPLAPLTVSFWLSFLAVFLILLFIKRQINQPRWMMLKLQLFLSLAMLPLTLLFFDSASLTSPVANLFAIPWVSLLIVPISLLALILMPFSEFISTQLLELSAILIDLLFKVLELLSVSILSQLSFFEIPTTLLLIAFLGVLVLILPKGFPAKWLGLLLFLPALSFQVEKPKVGEFHYTLLDVGQGYASVLSTQNHHLVYDTGGHLSDSFDLGKLVVAPYLKSKGINKLDMMMISHDDNDHRGGAEYLLNNIQINKVFTSNRGNIENLRKKKLKGSKTCAEGHTWQWDGVNFEVLSPSIHFVGNDNNRSCVLKIWNQYHSLLLTGDIEKKSEKALLETIPQKLVSEVLSVPHHGSKTSSTSAFLKQVSPEIGLISAGYRSRFGHPKPSIVKRYEDLGIELLDTVNYGAISLSFPADNKEINREYHRLEKQGFWSR